MAKMKGFHIHENIEIAAKRETFAFCYLGGVGSGKSQIITRIIDECIKRSYKKEHDNHRTFIYDIKGELTETLPHQAIMLAPYSDSVGVGKNKIASVGWDIAADCNTTTNARLVAELLIQDGGNDPMWSNAARMVLSGLMIGLNKTMGEEWSWGSLANILKKNDAEVTAFLNEHYPEAGARLTSLGEKTMGSVMLNLAADCSIIFDIAQAPHWQNAHKNGFAFKNWLFKKNLDNRAKTLILQGSNEFSLMSDTLAKVLISLFGALLLSPTVKDAPTRRINIFLDEFANLPKIERLPKMVSQLRSKGGIIHLGTQDWTQVEEVYGEKVAATIGANIGNKMFLATTIESAIWCSKQIGERRISIPNLTQTSDGGSSSSFQDILEPAVTPEEIAALPLATLKNGFFGYVKFRGWDDTLRLNWQIIDYKTLRPAVNPAKWTLPITQITKIDENENTKILENKNVKNKEFENQFNDKNINYSEYTDEDGEDGGEDFDEFSEEYSEIEDLENAEEVDLSEINDLIKKTTDKKNKFSKLRKDIHDKNDHEKDKKSAKTKEKIITLPDLSKDENEKLEDEDVAADEGMTHAMAAVLPVLEIANLMDEISSAQDANGTKTKQIIQQVHEQE